MMKRLGLVMVLAAGWAGGQGVEAARWKGEAARVTIARDDWGIAHVKGKTDADAVFGMIYAQCEDDFNRVEMNYLTALGRVAEAEGEKAIWGDLRQRLFVDPEELKKEYAGSPEWLKVLMDAWADGINFYLATHKETKAKVLVRWEPWMALSFTEGSIGGDIEKVGLKGLEEFYGGAGGGQSLSANTVPSVGRNGELAGLEREPGGSNGIAIGPKLTKDGHSLLLINPHTSFFFRSELQMASDEGLDAYGAVTWGQFFVYQGFNDRAGWMHTSSNVDAVDEYLETVVDATAANGSHGKVTRYGSEVRFTTNKPITLKLKTGNGMTERTIVAHFTVHGPVVRTEGGKWVAVQLMNTPVKALEQSYLRTKARSYAEYRKTMKLMANSSNNTIYADADGTIAYWHGDFIPRRDTKFDYTKPVDGSDPATDWKGLMGLGEIPQLKNPASGWLFNVNDSPWNGAGASSLKKADFPAYVEQGVESARGVHAMRVLEGKSGWTPESLMGAAYDSYLPWFARTLPVLLDGAAPDGLVEQLAVLKGWDYRWAAGSVATSLAVYWGTEVMRTAGPEARRAGVPSEEYVAAKVSREELLKALKVASDRLAADFGTWRTAWGEINRFQRLTGDIVQPFDDKGASLPVPFVSSVWGSLASFGARQYPGTKRWYGTSGNSFVAVVEFGPKVRAFAVTAGGESGHPSSKHFDDEAERYANGKLREVYFYPEEMKAHTERVYRPGDATTSAP